MIRATTLAAALCALGVLGLALPAQAAGDAAAGQALFTRNCSACHKRDASGGMKVGDTKSADLRSPGLEDQYHDNDAMIHDAILFGKDEEGGSLDKAMPRWKNRLTEAQVADIIAFLHTQKLSH